jgi:Uma2 family endonuclease
MPIASGQWTVADLLAEFGPIPASRVRHDPAPGTATAQDVIDIKARENRLYELVDGVLLEKTVGFYEAYLAQLLAHFLNTYVIPENLGVVTGADGMVRLAPGLIRIPDVSFVSWKRLPGGQIPRQPVPDLVPDLAVEVLSAANTQEEMQRKLREYFAAGVALVWYVDPSNQCVRVYHSPDDCRVVDKDDALDGGSLLPGFEVPLERLFREPPVP